MSTTLGAFLFFVKKKPSIICHENRFLAFLFFVVSKKNTHIVYFYPVMYPDIQWQSCTRKPSFNFLNAYQHTSYIKEFAIFLFAFIFFSIVTHIIEQNHYCHLRYCPNAAFLSLFVFHYMHNCHSSKWKHISSDKKIQVCRWVPESGFVPQEYSPLKEHKYTVIQQAFFKGKNFLHWVNQMTLFSIFTFNIDQWPFILIFSCIWIGFVRRIFSLWNYFS